MDLIALMPAFVVAVLLISASPGPAMALIFRRAALGGWRGGADGARPRVRALRLGAGAGAGLRRARGRVRDGYVVLKVVGAAVLLYSASGVALRLAQR